MSTVPADPIQIAQNFVKYYNDTFNTNRASLVSLYQPNSCLSFEGDLCQGQSAISERLQGLPLTTLQRQVDTMDVQPSGNTLLICVTGRLFVDSEQQPQRYSQVFLLSQSGTNFYILNDVFRLNYVLMLAALILLVFCVKARNGIVDLWRDKSILLVIAHPDDEVLFFGPTLVRGSKIANFHILCLTSGDSAGIGWIRKRELVRSLEQLGITNTEKISIIDDPGSLPDGFTCAWDLEKAAKIIEEHIFKWNIEILISFDHMGVSGHPNHISSSQACGLVAVRTDNVPFYSLYSLNDFSFWPLNVVCKYSGMVYAVLKSFIIRDLVLLSPYEYLFTLVPSMQRHRSQMVWFRKLYIVFSCYMFCNIYHKIKVKE
ncbi:hypothetical protein MDAP_002420 [Mitosporidium daphniae]